MSPYRVADGGSCCPFCFAIAWKHALLHASAMSYRYSHVIRIPRQVLVYISSYASHHDGNMSCTGIADVSHVLRSRGCTVGERRLPNASGMTRVSPLIDWVA
jgi:hypothetical protein